MVIIFTIKIEKSFGWDFETDIYGALIKFHIINKGYKDVFIEKPYLCCIYDRSVS